MKKLELKDILKPGAKLSAKPIDYNSPHVIKRLNEVKKQQKLCIERKRIDWSELANIYVTI